VYLKSLGLEHFRCYDRLDIDFGPGLHILVGGNAGGKTSILEAIYLLASTKSHRTAQDRQLIQWEHDWARAGGQFETGAAGSVSLRVTLRNGKSATNTDGPAKIVEVNSVPRRRFSDIIGQAAVVLFGPDDLSLIKGSPRVRRRFLNAGISQVRSAYVDDLMRHRRALRQRNECLKRHASERSQAEILCAWDSQLVESAASVSQAREEFVQDLGRHVRTIHQALSADQEEIEIAYDSDLGKAVGRSEKRDMMRELLERSFDRDVALGRTSRGPHRDEIDVTIGGQSVRSFGSQGQQRTAALALTLAQAQVIEEWRREAPILLLDDCLSELDEARARKVLELTQSVQQVIVTTASWDRLLEEYSSGARVFDVSHGTVQERGADAG